MDTINSIGNAKQILREVSRVIVGKDEVMIKVLLGIVAHVDRAARDDHRNGLGLAHVFLGVSLVFKLCLHFIELGELFFVRARAFLSEKIDYYERTYS